MDTVSCECNSCGAKIGSFFNLWTQIGKKYFSPIIDIQTSLDLAPHGPVRSGPKDTLVNECHLQDIACAKCSSILGIRCVSTPINHVLGENQILLCITSVNLVSPTDGSPTELVIKRFLKLQEPGSSDSVPGANGHRSSEGTAENTSRFPTGNTPGHSAGVHGLVDLSQIQADLESQREDIDRIDSTGFEIVQRLAGAVTSIENEVKQMKDTIFHLKQDMSGNQDDLASLKSDLREVRVVAEDKAALSRLESQIKSTDEAVGNVRREITAASTQFRKDFSGLKSELRQAKLDLEDLRATVSGSISAREHTKEMTALRAEMAQLRKDVEHSRSMSAERESSFPSRELDILTSNIAKIGSRASQVETLQMEFEIFKGRVERMEANKAAAESRSSAVSTSRPGPSYSTYQTDQKGSGDARQRRKRPSSGAEIPPVQGSEPSKRHAFSPDFTDTPAQEDDTSADWTQSSPPDVDSAKPTSRRAVDKVRLTKSGTVDKRSQRYVSRKSLPG